MDRPTVSAPPLRAGGFALQPWNAPTASVPVQFDASASLPGSNAQISSSETKAGGKHF